MVGEGHQQRARTTQAKVAREAAGIALMCNALASSAWRCADDAIKMIGIGACLACDRTDSMQFPTPWTGMNTFKMQRPEPVTAARHSRSDCRFRSVAWP